MDLLNLSNQLNLKKNLTTLLFMNLIAQLLWNLILTQSTSPRPGYQTTPNRIRTRSFHRLPRRQTIILLPFFCNLMHKFNNNLKTMLGT